ncbi:Uncharacterised protein [Mycobacteroides abscessus]|nr:Uncharacterised protein [Mycobacteroides abscessus]
MRRHTSNPSMSGRLTSRVVTTGSVRRTSSTPSTPVAAASVTKPA